MKWLPLICALATLVAGCSWLGASREPIPVYYASPGVSAELEAESDTPDTVATTSETSLLALKEAQVEELLHAIDSLYFQLDSLHLALETANSRIAVNPGFEIPLSITFAGREFELRNDRVFAKFEEIFQQELKSAHRWIPRSGAYFPVFDSLFAGTGVPLDVKYLAIAESNLNSMAESWVGAGGIWQFMPRTAKGYGLRVDDFIDERRNIFKSTAAAGRYLEEARLRLAGKGADDWLLAMCAYNAGVGAVEKAIRQQGGSDFFDLIMRVDETNRYVWRAVAIKMIFEHEKELFGQPFEREPSLYESARIATVSLKGHHKIDDWAQAHGTNVSQVWHLNPWIKMYQRRRGGNYSPINDVVLPPGDYEILLPIDCLTDSVALATHERKLLEKNSGYFSHHVVRRGDTLSGIALKYRTTVSRIKALNGLRSDVIYVGQRLRLIGSVSGGTSAVAGSAPRGATPGIYVVMRGDTIDGIARKLKVTRKHLIDLNNLVVHNQRGKRIVIIQPGQKLKY
ncbi:MAG: LysM peptidoglycan-binding domain-containing protein [Candidatus Cloacimonetes bacterium]|nr:LysM peptidoglycan-binding domain-containing protein [Candidatus Cloacimonadota bacterium]